MSFTRSELQALYTADSLLFLFSPSKIAITLLMVCFLTNWTPLLFSTTVINTFIFLSSCFLQTFIEFAIFSFLIKSFCACTIGLHWKLAMYLVLFIKFIPHLFLAWVLWISLIRGWVVCCQEFFWTRPLYKPCIFQFSGTINIIWP